MDIQKIKYVITWALTGCTPSRTPGSRSRSIRSRCHSTTGSSCACDSTGDSVGDGASLVKTTYVSKGTILSRHGGPQNRAGQSLATANSHQRVVGKIQVHECAGRAASNGRQTLSLKPTIQNFDTVIISMHEYERRQPLSPQGRRQRTKQPLP